MTNEKTFKDVESILYSYKKTLAEIKEIELEIEELSETYKGVNSGNQCIKPSTQTYKISDLVFNEVVQREYALEQLEKIKRSKERNIKKIENMVTIFSSEEAEFIRLKYFEKKKGKEIENILLLTRDGCSNRRKKAIKKLTDFLNSTHK